MNTRERTQSTKPLQIQVFRARSSKARHDTRAASTRSNARDARPFDEQSADSAWRRDTMFDNQVGKLNHDDSTPHHDATRAHLRRAYGGARVMVRAWREYSGVARGEAQP